MILSFALILQVAAPESRPAAPRAEEPIVVVLQAGDARLADKGPSQVVETRAESAGRLNVWAVSSALDPWLAVEDDQGRPLAEDGDSGGGTTPFVALPVQAGQLLRLRVASTAPEGAGEVRIFVRGLPETPEVWTATDRLQDVLRAVEQLRTKQDFDAARERLRAGVAEFLAVPGIDRSERAQAALKTAIKAAYKQDDEPTCLALARALCRAAEGAFPPESRRVQNARMSLGSFLTYGPGAAEGLAMLEGVVEVERRTLPAEDDDRIKAQGELADALNQHGEYWRSRELWRETLAALERTKPPGNILLAAGRLNYATVLYALGEYREARRIEELVRAVYEELYDETSLDLASIRQNLASTLSELGDKEGALVLHRQALAIFERVLPENHVNLLKERGNVAQVLRTLGRLEESRELFEQVVQGCRATLPEEDETRLWAELSLATVLDGLGQHERARSILEAMLAVQLRTQSQTSELWRTQAELAASRGAVGELEAALELQEQALAGLTLLRPLQDPDVQDLRNHLAQLDARLGRSELAVELALETARSSQDYFSWCALALSAREAESAAKNLSRLASAGLSLLALAEDTPSEAAARARAFALAESSRGIGATALRCARIGGQSSEEIEIRRLRIREASARIAALVGSSAGPESLHEATAAKERAERELRTALGALRGGEALAPALEPSAIGARLSKPDAAVGFWVYDRQLLAKGGPIRRERSLAAFVLRPDGSLRRVELGPCAPIDDAVETWRQALVSPGASGREAGERLRKLVLDPLREAAGGAKRWIVALDGSLHRVPLDALPLEEGLFGDAVEVDVRATLSELTLKPAPIVGSAALLAIGGVDYDNGPDLQTTGAAEAAALRGSSEAPAAAPSAIPKSAEPQAPPPAAPPQVPLEVLRGGAWKDGFPPLWETADEALAVASLFRETHPDVQAVDVLVETAATRTALLEGAPKARFLHVGTHGFFGSGAAGSAVQGDEDVRSFAPLALCGLALAGANLPPDADGAVSGVVTAEELGSLDLSGCELAVLSACDTNVGELRSGQGIASFQKALHAAGARTVITSLWKVPDAQTRELMLAFYRGLWVEKLPKAQALWRAKQQLRGQRLPPRDWAGWVLSGNPD
jgi:CHAT domain-containing protein/tetratricopeptide (TPR) repeat protein